MRRAMQPGPLEAAVTASKSLCEALLPSCLAAVLVTAGCTTAPAPPATSAPPSDAQSAAGPSLDAETQPKAEAVIDGETPATYANTLKWSTASEVDNFGYDIYRGEAEDGPFERITDDPITGAGTTDEVSRYRYDDDRIDPYKRYFYYVESISMSGARERFTPIFPAKPKLTREKDAAGGSSPGEK